MGGHDLNPILYTAHVQYLKTQKRSLPVILFERVGERGQSQPERLNADVSHFQEHKQCFGWEVEELPYVSEKVARACSLSVRKEAVEEVLCTLVCIPGKGSASAGDSLLCCRGGGAFKFEAVVCL
jgi:hypothetical protein